MKEWGQTQSDDKSLNINRKLKQKLPQQQKNTPQKFDYTQLWTDLGRSVRVATVTKLVWINQLTGAQPSHYPEKLCNHKDTHLKIHGRVEDQQSSQAEMS